MEKLDQLLRARKGLGLSLQQLQVQERALPHARAALGPAIVAIKAQQKQIDQDMEVLTKSSADKSNTGADLACVAELQKVPFENIFSVSRW